MKIKNKLKDIFLVIVVVAILCLIISTRDVLTKPTMSDMVENDEEYQLLIDRANSNAHRLEFINAYGNNSAYHPSVINFGKKWNGYKYWMAHTPYPNADDKQENPHIMVSNDLETWVEPKGFKNPLEPAPKSFKHQKIYNSDTELVYNADTQNLECWWRFVDDVNNDLIIYRKTTKDGITWSEKEIILQPENRNVRDYISPALLYEDNKYKMWYLDSPYTIYYTESEDVKTWTEPVKINIEYKDSRLRSWHLDVVHEDGLYEMVVNAFVNGETRREMNLYYSKSKDNINWTKAKTILKPSKNINDWDGKGIYRSSLMYEGDECYLFYSAIPNKFTNIYEGVGIVKLNDNWRKIVRQEKIK